jgi:hypothetical protein
MVSFGRGMPVASMAADEVRGAVEGVTVFLADLVENSNSAVYDLRADTVATE